MKVRTKFDVRSFTRSSANRGTLKFRAVPRSLFSKMFHWLLFGWTLWMYQPS